MKWGIFAIFPPFSKLFNTEFSFPETEIAVIY